MAERNINKPRVCNKCKQTFETTAKGIKDHVRECKS
jgi:hypothetical protein